MKCFETNIKGYTGCGVRPCRWVAGPQMWTERSCRRSVSSASYWCKHCASCPIGNRPWVNTDETGKSNERSPTVAHDLWLRFWAKPRKVQGSIICWDKIKWSGFSSQQRHKSKSNNDDWILINNSIEDEEDEKNESSCRKGSSRPDLKTLSQVSKPLTIHSYV